MSSSSIADTDLLQGIAAGEAKAVHRMYQDYFPRILSYVRKNNGNEEAARDLFQDALMVVYKKAQDPSFRLESALFTYLYAVCRNLWLKKLKRSDKERVTSYEDGEYNCETAGVTEAFEGDEELVHEARYQLYRRKFRELGEACQKILSLSLAGKSMEFIVKEMSLSSVGYARKRKFKCKEQLMRRVQNDPAYRELAV